MGVKWLLKWKPQKGRLPGPAQEQVLLTALDRFQAKAGMKDKRFELTCKLLKQAQLQDPTLPPRPGALTMKDMWLLQWSDASETCYLVNRPDHHVLECDPGMVRILELKMDYKAKVTVRVEGRRYLKGDFSLKLLSATQQVSGVGGQHSLVGHVVEVEYTPLAHLEVAGDIMQEFLELFAAHIPRDEAGQPLGSFEVVRPSYPKYSGLTPSFGRQHAAIMYADLAVLMLTTQG